MKKICSIVGARPQFIKLAVVSKELRKCFQEVILHTGQHYDNNMSGIFFNELDIPAPDYNLGICGGTHGQMTGTMLIKIEKVLLREQPDMVVVFGDTNSTLAGALAAVKLHIPVCHVEAGHRLGTYENPEEVNRIVTDHVSSLNLAVTVSAVDSLRREGLSDSSRLVGDPMYDAFQYYGEKLDGSELKGMKDLDGNPIVLPNEFYYMTCHRQENTDTDEALSQIFQAMEELDAPVIYPVHPRNHMRALRLCQDYRCGNLILTDPVGYLTSISLVRKAKKIITDSGGLQREAFFAKRPCVTVMDRFDIPELMKNNCNQLTKPLKGDILKKMHSDAVFDPDYQPFGDGCASRRVAEEIRKFWGG